MFKGALEQNDTKKFKDKCGIDPITDLEQIVLSYKDMTNFVVALKVKFDQAKAESCIKEMGGELSKAGDLLQAVIDGDTKYIKWSKGVALVGTSPESLAKAGEGGGLAGNKEIMAFISKADTKAAIWGAGRLPAEITRSMDFGQLGGGAPPEGFYFSVDTGKELTFTAAAIFPDAEDVKKIKALLDLGLMMAGSDEQIGPVLKKLKIDTSGKELKISLSLTEDEIKKLGAMAPGMLPF
jgi:DNA-binding protein